MIVRRLDGNHDMTFGQGRANFCERAEAVAQTVRCRLLTLRGEWFLDINAGVPWLQQITVKPSNLQLAEALLKAEILGSFGVVGLESFQLIVSDSTRELTVLGVVKNIYGETTNIKVTQ